MYVSLKEQIQSIDLRIPLAGKCAEAQARVASEPLGETPLLGMQPTPCPA